MPFRLRKAVALLCIAITVFAAALPAAALGLPEALLTPVWLYEPPAAITPISNDLASGHEHPVALLNVLVSRGPPVRLTA
jgi:hypothetical protein